MATITYIVTVASGQNAFSASNPKFFINGEVSPAIEFQEGNTYIFDQADTTCTGYLVAFSTTTNGTFTAGGAAYTDGVTTTGTPGTAGAQTQNLVAPVQTIGAPVLFYYDGGAVGTSGMGNKTLITFPTSGTTVFNPTIDEIIEEAYERTNIRGTRTGYQLRSARRSLNIMFQEWANRGIHLWKIKLAQIPLVLGQAEYSFASDSVNFPNDVDEVLEAYYRNNSVVATPSDIAITKISRSQYNNTPNKLTQGTPSQYYAQRKLSPSIFLYATPSTSVSSTTTPSSFQLCFYYMAKIQDVGVYTNTADVVNRFYPVMCSGLAYYLSMKYSAELTPALERTYESEMLRALDADNQGTSSFISPQTFFGGGV